MKSETLFWVIVGVLALIVGLLVAGAIISLTAADSGTDLLSATCAAAFLVVAFVAWEVLMKPGYRRRRREEREPEEERSGDAGEE